MNFLFFLAQAATNVLSSPTGSPSPSSPPASTPTPSSTPPMDSVAELINWTNLALIYTSVAICVYIALLLVGRWIKKRFNVPFGWWFNLFAFFAALWLAGYVPNVNPPSKDDTMDTALTSFNAAMILTGAFVAISFLRHYLFDIAARGNLSSKGVPKFISQIISILIFLAAVGFVLQFNYHVEVPGLLAGAGIVGIVLGLALQDTLGNIFSGFAIYFGGQFKSGDWLKVGDEHAEIMEVNWRSIRLRTEDNVYLDIPNSNITKETVMNFSHPTPLHALRLEIGLDYEVPPSKVRPVLIDAALAASHVLCEPAPTVYLKEFAASSVNYQIKFWMNDHSKYEEAYSSIRTNLWYALRRHNISIPYPIQMEMSYDPPQSNTDRKALIGNALGKIFFAECLSETQIAHLIDCACVNHFGQGEQIIRQGRHDSSMYVILEGRADIIVESGGIQRTVATIGAGDCIGEMSLLTGECRSATVMAVEDTQAVEISKPILAPLIAESPELLEVLSDLLARRRMQNEGVLAQALSDAQLKATRENYRSGFLTKLQSFFAI